MIKINKRPLPSGIIIKNENDYRSDPVFKILIEDFNKKCYICEDSVHTSPNVEHRISHKNNHILKYDWNNLFLSCAHCNNTKSDKYDGIIDPTQIDPEEFIEFLTKEDEELRPLIIIRKIKWENDVDITINLLLEVYENSKTAAKKIACKNLRKKLNDELAIFRQTLEEFRTNLNNISKLAIENELSDKSLFAAFKRNLARIILNKAQKEQLALRSNEDIWESDFNFSKK